MIRHYRSSRGRCIYATPNWLQALGGLRQTAKIRMEAPEEKVSGPSSVDNNKRWLRVSAAAEVASVHAGLISRAVESGRLLSNGLRGSERRVCAIDLCRWLRERAGHQEPTESTAHVEALVHTHVRD